MNPLIKKEIRLLWPAWLIVLTLAVVLPWFENDPNDAFRLTPVFFFFGMILLAVDSFGREFSLGTFSSLLAQPVERRQIWRTKITVLFFAAALIFAAYVTSHWLQLRLELATPPPMWRAIEINAWHIKLINNFQEDSIISAAVAFVAVTGGLWTALLFRQIAAAFWITFLAPAGLLMATLFFLPSNLAANEHIFTILLYGLAGLYSGLGFWLAHRLFHQVQDAGWTGGVVSFSSWRYFESGSKSSISTRHLKPIAALIKKEFQLQSISWFCAAALLTMHLAVILMRYVHGSFERDSVASVTSEFFWAIWLIMPLIICSTAVAEERRLGVTEGQFCQPASRRLQFILKFFLAIISGLLLGGLMPLLLEGIAGAIGAPNPDFKSFYYLDSGVSPITVLGLSLGLSLAAFYASSLTKNFMQAIGIAVIIIIGCWLFTYIAGQWHSFLGIIWNPALTIGFSILAVLVMAPWLAYRNFKYVQESGRVWRQNAFGLTCGSLFIFIGSAALYNRAWEVFEPAEPAHGPARLSLAIPPTLQNGAYGSLMVRLPDGRVWFDCVNYPQLSWFKSILWPYVHPFPVSIGPQKFMEGSNWVSATGQYINTWVQSTKESQTYDKHIFGYTESVGIQSDGTLWVSDKSEQNVWTANKITRFGEGTHWQKVVQSWGFSSVLLLKKDGTLWFLGTNDFAWRDWPKEWPGLRSFEPYQIGTNSDWSDIASDENYLAQRDNGSVWRIERNNKDFKDQFRRDTNYDQVSLHTFAEFYETRAWVRKDGTLWISDLHHTRERGDYSKVDQIGKDKNWVSVAVTWNMIIAVKSDGSLWQWERTWSDSYFFGLPPTRLSIHNDWIAVASAQADSQGGLISLAADGSLWFWPYRGNYEYQRYQGALLKLPKQPQFLCNIFDKSD